MPTFASTDRPKSVIPYDHRNRYKIPRYPFSAPLPQGTAPAEGTGMLVPWTRVSTLLDTHEDKEGIFKWTKRLVVKGLGAREDLYALAAATRLEDKSGLLRIADQAFDYAKGQAASNLGSALHGFLERWVEGDPTLTIPSQWKADIGAVMTAFQAHNIRLRPDLQEMVVVRPDLKDGDAAGLAGRFDLVVEMLNPETGEWELIVADYKTGSDPLAYGSWKIQQQLGLYGTGWATWDGTHWHPMPTIRRDKILMVHVLPGQASVQIHIGDVDPEVLEEDLQAAYRTRRRRKEAKKAWRPLVTVEDGAIVGDEIDQHAEIVVSQAEKDAVAQFLKPMDEAISRDAERAAATVARVAAESNPNTDGDDEQCPECGHQPHLPAACDPGCTCHLTGQSDEARVAYANGDDEPRLEDRAEANHRRNAEVRGTDLAPLAGPGERGCGVCGRKGHRRNSPKCLGDQDPHALSVARGATSFVVETEEGGHCRCTHRSKGWTAPADGDGPWVCGDCGLPSRAGQIDGTGHPADPMAEVTYVDALSGEIKTAPAGEVKLGVSVPVLERTTGPTPAEIEQEETRRATYTGPDDGLMANVAAVEADPFDEDGSDALTPADVTPTWLDRIQVAESKADLRDIRAEALAKNEWTQELTAAGLERMKSFAPKG